MDEKFINDYKKFLDGGKTERECTSQIIEAAEKHGYKDIAKYKTLKAGDKVYVQKMHKTVALFEIGTDSLEDGMNILGAHIDSPRLDVKQNPVYEHALLRRYKKISMGNAAACNPRRRMQNRRQRYQRDDRRSCGRSGVLRVGHFAAPCAGADERKSVRLYSRRKPRPHFEFRHSAKKRQTKKTRR